MRAAHSLISCRGTLGPRLADPPQDGLRLASSRCPSAVQPRRLTWGFGLVKTLKGGCGEGRIMVFPWLVRQ